MPAELDQPSVGPPAEAVTAKPGPASRGLQVLGSRFGRRLLLLILACALIPILLLGVLAYREVTTNLRLQSERRLNQQTKAVALGIVERLLLLESSLDLVKLELTRGSADDVFLSSSLRQVLGRQLEALALVRGDGPLEPLHGGDIEVPALDLLAREHLARGRMLVVARGRSPGAPRPGETEAQIVPVLAAKRMDPDRPAAGTLWARVAGTYLWDVGPDSGLPPQTELAVLDERGFLVRADPVPAELASRFFDEARRDGIGLEWQAAGKTFLASHRTIPLATNYAVGPWIVSVSRRLDLALAPIAGFRRDFPRFVALMALVVFLLSLSQIRRSLVPFEALAAGTRRLARRDFSEPVEVQSGDELEMLASAFNDMSAALERQLRVLATMAEVGRRALADPREEAAVETLLQALPEVLPAHGAEIVLTDGPGDLRRFSRRADGLVDQERWPSPPPSPPGDRLAATVTIDGGVRGEVAILGHREESSPDDKAILRELADHLGLVLRHVKLRGALERERERLRSLVEHLPNGIILLDGRRKVQLTNRLGREVLADLTEVDLEDTVSRVGGRPFDRLISDEGVRWHELELEGEKRRVFVVAITPLTLGETDAGQGSVIVVRDVTAEREAEARARRQERLATVGRLAAGVAHDFNNVLQGIMMGAGLLASRTDGREAKVIMDQCNRAADMISRILDFTRASTSRPKDLDLRDVVEEGLRLIRMAIPEPIEVVITLPDEPMPVRVDGVQIQQVVQNLVVNARDAMPDGGTLTLSLGRADEVPRFAPPGHQGPWCLLRVVDTGSGIPASVRPHIFDPFFTTKQLGVGTGLGLAQVLGIVEQHGGGIDVETGPGGTTFTVALPGSGSLATPTAVTVEPARIAAPAQGRLVVVADDDDMVLESLTTGLSKLGYRVLAARSGREAWSYLQDPALDIDLVLSDVRMPDLSGVELRNRIAGLEDPPPVILMSGYAGAEGRDMDIGGLGGWLEKPFAFHDLARVTAVALKGRSKR